MGRLWPLGIYGGRMGEVRGVFWGQSAIALLRGGLTPSEIPSMFPLQLASGGSACSAAGAAGRGCSFLNSGSVCPYFEADEPAALRSKGVHGYGGQKKGARRPLWDIKFFSSCLISSPGAECPVCVFIVCNNRCFLMSARTDSLLSGFVPQNCVVGRAIGTCLCLLCF